MIILIVVFSALATAAIADETFERQRKVAAHHKTNQLKAEQQKQMQYSVNNSRVYMSQWLNKRA